MRKTILLHVGLPKTGTTSIQDLLAANSADLERDGVLFPIVRQDIRDAGRARGIGVGWHLALTKFVWQKPGALKPGEWEAWTDTFARFAASPDLHTLIVSQEGLMGHNAKGVAALMAALPAGDRRIMLVLRPAEPWLTSLYEQLIRSEVRIATPPGEFRAALNYAATGFEGTIARIVRMTGGAALDLLSFDDLAAGDGLLVNFVRAAGLPEWLETRALEARRANPGLPQDMVALLRACNAVPGVDHAEFVGMRRALARGARRRKGPRERTALFPPELSARIADRYERDRIFLARDHGLELKPARALPPPGRDPMALDAATLATLRGECAPFLTADGLATFDRIAAAMLA